MIFVSKVKYEGIFSFKDFYKFCYDWLTEETDLLVQEEKYAEKIEGNAKNIDIEWVGKKKLSDYFQFVMKVKFKILYLSKVEINKDGKKISTNKGIVEISAKGIIARDYQGKFEVSPAKKVWRGIYEKFVIPSRIKQVEDKIIGDSDEFLGQAKAYLDIEGKK
jgi:hypothetical protein